MRYYSPFFCLTTSAFAKHHHHHDDSDQAQASSTTTCFPCPGRQTTAQVILATIPASAESADTMPSSCMACGRRPAAGRRRCRARTRSPVAAATVDHMLNFMPSRSLIQHEWQKHGTCTGLSAQDYFAQAEQAYTHVQVPQQYRSLDHEQQFSVSDLEKSFAEANHAPLAGLPRFLSRRRAGQPGSVRG